MPEYQIPYGKTALSFHLPERLQVEVIAPAEMPQAPDPVQEVVRALENPCGGVRLESFAGAGSVAIAVNDKTRPVPLDRLLPPLLRKLEATGLLPENILFVFATGVHAPMRPDEFRAILPSWILERYRAVSHDAGDQANLLYLGETSRGTPVWVNRLYVSASLRIVVGDIEPHQFMGFSGGVKSAAIGLAGKETIHHNHAWMTHPDSRLGSYAANPTRQDVEEIGEKIGVHFAVNALLNGRKEIVRVLAGEPRSVMEEGIPLALQICTAPVTTPYDLMIISPGGHPKDINLYQGQKALGHAMQVARLGGRIILAAACPEGTGSQSYEDWVLGMSSFDEVLARFKQEGFRVGPHKAWQFARDASQVHLSLLSEMSPEFVNRLLLEPASSLEAALAQALPALPGSARVGIMPQGNVTIPVLR